MKIGFLLFDKVTQLDAMGPMQMLSRMPDAQSMTIAKARAPVTTDCPVELVPTHDFDSAPDLDLLCVPGGFGIVDAMADRETLDFVRAQVDQADYVTYVCTGAFILGAVGALRGKRATTHWAYTELLPLVGAIHEDARVVRDGNVFTGGGVTAGIDFALTVMAAIAGDGVAQSIQLGLEYDPAPPFSAGSPARAPEKIRTRMANFYKETINETRNALDAALVTQR